jgi:hypothetical protein
VPWLARNAPPSRVGVNSFRLSNEGRTMFNGHDVAKGPTLIEPNSNPYLIVIMLAFETLPAIAIDIG